MSTQGFAVPRRTDARGEYSVGKLIVRVWRLEGVCEHLSWGCRHSVEIVSQAQGPQQLFDPSNPPPAKPGDYRGRLATAPQVFGPVLICMGSCGGSRQAAVLPRATVTQFTEISTREVTICSIPIPGRVNFPAVGQRLSSRVWRWWRWWSVASAADVSGCELGWLTGGANTFLRSCDG